MNDVSALPGHELESPSMGDRHRSVRVAFLTGHLGTGGSEIHLIRLVKGLDQRRFPTEVIVLWTDGLWHQSMVESGVKIHDLHMTLGLSALITGARRLRSILQERRPDVLHTYGYVCNLLGTAATVGLPGIKLVTTRRGNEFARRRQIAYRAMNRAAARVVSVSEATERFAMQTEGLNAKRSLVIPNGLDLTPLLAVPRARTGLQTMGTVGRIRPVKGTDLLVDAYRELGRPDVPLRIAGPAYQSWGEQFVAQHQDIPGLEFLDAVVDIPRFLGEIDLFILPSRSEGMSNALIEAMAAGLPIIATNVGGNRETLGDGAAGILVRPDARELAEAMRHLLTHPEEAQALGRRARERAAREYGLSTMIERYERFYEELVLGDPGARR